VREVIKIEQAVPVMPRKKRVAAYARVSVEKDRSMHSLSAQVSFYSALIQKHAGWEYAGVYADGGQSGTGDGRAEFQRLLADCEAGNIDIILTKSISRFARNTVDLLKTVRRLRELGVEVRFEKEGINTMDSDGELMLTILGSFAQEESRSLGENIKWAIKKAFNDGKPNSFNVYGYRWNGEKFIVEPEEAEVVRMIYDDYLDGKSPRAIARRLAAMGVRPMYADKFPESSVRMILENDKYTGDLVLQKTYTENHITHRDMRNNGELPKYIISNAHEAIIDRDTFAQVQREKERRKTLGCFATGTLTRTAFTSKIYCEACGRNFYRSTRSHSGGKYRVWMCANRKEGKPHSCEAGDVPENVLERVSAEVLGLDAFDVGVFGDQIRQIVVPAAHSLVFHFHDGRVVTKVWESTARTDCWTPERRVAWSEYQKGNNHARRGRKRNDQK